MDVGDYPGPGIYENVPFDTYLSWPWISNSSLNSAERSLLHYKHRKPIQPTEPMRFGTLCHSGKLEPTSIYRRYVVMPDLTKDIKTKDGKPATNPKATAEYDQRVNRWAEENAGGKEIVSQADFDRMLGVVSAVNADPLAHRWFSDAGHTEVSIVWDDPETGLRCKSRLDKVATGERVIADLKTCADCRWFHRDIATRNYHRQGGMYQEGWAILNGGEMFAFGLAAVESEHPFGTMTAPVCQDDLEAGNDAFHACLRKIKAAQQSNHWPGYESPAEWRMPGWKSEATEAVQLVIGGETVSL
jgi:exodeoxyribonuclease VIII